MRTTADNGTGVALSNRKNELGVSHDSRPLGSTWEEEEAWHGVRKVTHVRERGRISPDLRTSMRWTQQVRIFSP